MLAFAMEVPTDHKPDQIFLMAAVRENSCARAVSLPIQAVFFPNLLKAVWLKVVWRAISTTLPRLRHKLIPLFFHYSYDSDG